MNKAQPITEQKQAVENQGELFETDQLQTTEEQKIADQATLLEAEEPIVTPPRPALTEAREQATGMQTSEDIDSLIRVREKLAALKAKNNSSLYA